MRKVSFKPYLFLIGSLFLLLSLPKQNQDEIRSIALSVLAPPFELASAPFQRKEIHSKNEIQPLKVENALLRAEVVRLQHLLQHEKDLMEHFGDKVFTSSHQSDLYRFLELQLISIPSQVILRSSGTWESSLWINQGLEANERYKREVIGKNSPVIVGDSIIGVIDYVGQKRSRVKLIGDPELAPSVRALREIDGNRIFLAKGELQGIAKLSKRREIPILVGTGFNYDFPDEEGPARDLRTGEPYGQSGESLPIIEVGDHLITTGMDGVFPKGFSVGKVTKITPLKEGDFYFEIEAEATAKNLNSLSLVFVLPPI
jgi:cell shape-determining protein MreC